MVLELGGGVDADDDPADGPHHACPWPSTRRSLRAFAKIHKRYLTPTVSTLAMGAVSIVLYVVMNYSSAGNA